MDKMEERTRQRILDLANLADRRGIITYTDFMNLRIKYFSQHGRKDSICSMETFRRLCKSRASVGSVYP